MKNVWKVFILVICIVGILQATALATDEISVLVNGEILDFTDEAGNKVGAQIVNDRTMVPMRKIFEVLGAKVDWDESTRGITATKDGYTMELHIDNREVKYTTPYGWTTIELDTAPMIINNRTMVPVRFVAEGLHQTVLWNAEKRMVIIFDAESIDKLVQSPVLKADISLCDTQITSEKIEDFPEEIQEKYQKFRAIDEAKSMYFTFEYQGKQYACIKFLVPQYLDYNKSTVKVSKAVYMFDHLELIVEEDLVGLSVPEGMIVDQWGSGFLYAIIEIKKPFKTIHYTSNNGMSEDITRPKGSITYDGKKNRYGLVGENLDFVLPLEYNNIKRLEEITYYVHQNKTPLPDLSNYYMLTQNNKNGIADKSGNIILECVYDDIQCYGQNAFLVTKEVGRDSQVGIVDHQGNILVEFTNLFTESDELPNEAVYISFSYEDVFEQEPYLVYNVKIRNNGVGYMPVGSGIIDSKLHRVIAPIYSQIDMYHCENDSCFFVVTKGEGEYIQNRGIWEVEKRGIVDSNGSIVLDCEYKDIKCYGTSAFLVMKEEGDATKIGKVDLKGNYIVPLKDVFDSEETKPNEPFEIYFLKEDSVLRGDRFISYVMLKRGENGTTNNFLGSGILDSQLNIVVPPKYEEAYSLHKGDTYYFKIYDNSGKQAVFNETGRVIIDFTDDMSSALKKDYQGMLLYEMMDDWIDYL